MLRSLITTLETTKVTALSFLGAFLSVVVLRVMFEGFSSPSENGAFPVDPTTVVHYLAYFLALYFAFSLVLGVGSGDYTSAPKIALWGTTFLLLPPVLDFILSGGEGAPLFYLITIPSELFTIYATFFDFLGDAGATLGVRITLFATILIGALYVYLKTHNILRVFIAGFLIYTIVFVFGSFPSVLYALTFPTVLDGGPFVFLQNIFTHSSLIHNALPATLVPLSSLIAVETGFNALMTACFSLVATVFGVITLGAMNRRVLTAHLQNLRPLRVVHALFLVGGGVLVGYTLSETTLSHFADLLSLLCLVGAWIAACYFAVCINDLEDEAIDAVSNTERPLVTGRLTRNEMQNAAGITFFFMLLLGSAAGYYSLFFLLAFTGAYYAYSASPLRLKGVPVVAPFLISIAALSAIGAGFFFSYPFKESGAFPSEWIFGIVVFYTLLSNFKDLKDIEGDEKAGIMTLAVLLSKKFGKQAAHHMLGALLALAFLSTLLFFSTPYLWILALVASVLGYSACVRTPYQERYVLIVMILFLLGGALLTLL